MECFNLLSLIIAGLISAAFYGSYSVTKYGVEAFSDALRREMYPWGIKVSMLEPGSHTTNICAPDMFEQQLKKGWNQLSDVVKDEYGEEYLSTGEFDDKPASYAEDSSLDSMLMAGVNIVKKCLLITEAVGEVFLVQPIPYLVSGNVACLLYVTYYQSMLA